MRRTWLSLALVVAAACSDTPDGTTPVDGGTVDVVTSPDGAVPDSAVADGATSNAEHFRPELLGPKALPPPVGCPAVGAGQCRWVSPTGTGTACTEVAPCRVKTAIAALKPGDVVLFQSGTYDAGNGSLDRIVLDKYGPIATTAQSPIVFRNAANADVIIRGDKQVACTWIDGTSYLTFEGFTYEDCFEAGVRIGEDVPAATSHVTVQNDEFRGIVCNDNMGAIMVNGVAGVTFRNNVVHDFVKGNTKGLGMVIFRGKDLTVVNNEFRSLAEGIYYKHGEAKNGNGGFTRFQANYFHDIPGFALGVNQNRTEIAYDLFVDSGGVMLFQADGTVGDFVFDVHLHHDTFVRSDMAPMQRGDGFSGAQRTTIDHSIFHDGKLEVWQYGLDADFVKGIGFASDRNCFFSTKGPPVFDYFASTNPAYGPKGASYGFTEWKALGFDTASAVVDPGLDPKTFVASAPACAGYGAYAP